MAKTFRRSIRIQGKTINSERFSGKDAKRLADEWYSRKLKEKEMIEAGMVSSGVTTFFDYSSQWLKERIKNYPEATSSADETRLRLYLVPAIGELPLKKITRNVMRDVLVNIQEEYGLSVGTRTLIKALASKIFTDAMNEEPPLIEMNPCSRLVFNEARQGRKKKPPTLRDEDEVKEFLSCAFKIGKMEGLICSVAVLAGLRKSELSALQYRHVSARESTITVEQKVESASLTIKSGTKGGADEERVVPVPAVLLNMIAAYRKESPFNSETDFIFCDAKGNWIRPRKLHSMIDQVVKAFGRPVTLHKLRHSFGRMFIRRGGNKRVLQDMLGHKSSAMTDRYSEQSEHMSKAQGDVMHIFEALEVTNQLASLPPKRHQNGDHDE